MQKDDTGVWTVNTAPLPPDYYGYSIIVDGQRSLDPYNSLLKPNLLSTENMVHVQGPPSLPWELNDVPHGEIHHHFYSSTVANDDRDYFVYTPPGYDPAKNRRIPFCTYCMAIATTQAAGQQSVARMSSFDNLIEQGKAKPMIVVMPLATARWRWFAVGWGGLSNHPEVREQNVTKFREALLTEVMPQVEAEYRIDKDRNQPPLPDFPWVARNLFKPG